MDRYRVLISIYLRELNTVLTRLVWVNCELGMEFIFESQIDYNSRRWAQLIDDWDINFNTEGCADETVPCRQGVRESDIFKLT